MHMLQSLFLSDDCRTCFEYHYQPSSGEQNNCNYSIICIINNNCNFNLIYRYSLTAKTVYYSVMVTRCCSYSCFVLLKMGDNDTRNMYSNHQIKINSVTCASCWDFYIRILLWCTDPRVLTLRWLMSYIYGAPILDVSRSHTTTQHSR